MKHGLRIYLYFLFTVVTLQVVHSREAFKCVEKIVKNKKYLYCGHNNKLYEPIVNTSKLESIRMKLMKIKKYNKTKETMTIEETRTGSTISK